MNGSTDSPVYDDAGRLTGLIPVFRENAIAAIEAGKTEEAAEEISKLFDAADRLLSKRREAVPGRSFKTENYAPADAEKGFRMIMDAAVLIARYASKCGKPGASVAVQASLAAECEYVGTLSGNDEKKDLFSALWPLCIDTILKAGTESAKGNIPVASSMALEAVSEALDSRVFDNVVKADDGLAFFDEIYRIVSENMSSFTAACRERFNEEDIGAAAAVYGKLAAVTGEMYITGKTDGQCLIATYGEILDDIGRIAAESLTDVLDDAASASVSEAGDIYTDLTRAYRKKNPAAAFPDVFREIRGKLENVCRSVHEKAVSVYAENTQIMCEAVIWNLEDEMTREQQVR